MKFALLGVDSESLALVRSIAASREHQLICYSLAIDDPRDPGSSLRQPNVLAAEINRHAPLATEELAWERLLDSRRLDAVIVATGASPASARFDQLRRLVQQEMPVVVSFPLTMSVLEAYELELVRQETNSVVVPLLPLRWLGDSAWLAGVAREARAGPAPAGSLGRLEQLEWDRQLVDCSRDAVLRQLARDIDFIRCMCGELTQVAAMGPGTTQSLLAPLAIQLTGPAGVLIRVSVQQATDAIGGRLMLFGAGQQMTLTMPDEIDPRGWRLSSSASGGALPIALPTSTYSETSLADEVAAAVERNRQQKARPLDPTWSDATRSLELIEAVEKSLRRGKTVGLSFEGRGEEEAFKGTMASIGCGLLIAGLLLTIAASVALKVAQVTGHHALERVLRWWPASLLALLVVFLLMQLLRWVIPRDGTTADEETSTRGETESTT